MIRVLLLLAFGVILVMGAFNALQDVSRNVGTRAETEVVAPGPVVVPEIEVEEGSAPPSDTQSTDAAEAASDD